MKKLIRPMKIAVMMFTATKYFYNEKEMLDVIEDIKSKISAIYDAKFVSVIDGQDFISDIEDMKEHAVIMIPISGSVQPGMLEAAGHFKAVSICPGYNEFIASKSGRNIMLKNNTAPAAMDVYAVLKRSHDTVEFFTDFKSFDSMYRSVRAYHRLKESKLMIIGKTEEWVISATRDKEKIVERFGIKVIEKPLNELKEVYEKVTNSEVKALYSEYIKSNIVIEEPDKDDLMRSFRLIQAIKIILKQYDCDGLAIACFKLLAEFKTTSCMALSYLNDSKDFIGSCEGDLDSAVTLMLMKSLTGNPGFMANPVVINDKVIELSHCSAPLCMNGKKSNYKIRNHHESGIGVSPQVELDEGKEVTLVRIGNEMSEINAFTGSVFVGEKLPVCRTQISVEVEHSGDYLKNSLGCHLVMTYGNFMKELRYIKRLTGLKLI